jgi:hypothetical protein
MMKTEPPKQILRLSVVEEGPESRGYRLSFKRGLALGAFLAIIPPIGIALLLGELFRSVDARRAPQVRAELFFWTQSRAGTAH